MVRDDDENIVYIVCTGRQIAHIGWEEWNMKVRVLGCGSSGGVPSLIAGWGQCDPTNKKNYRTRPALFIEEGATRILVDAGPDIRTQLLPLRPQGIDGLFVTHFHADHIGGIDDLRPLNMMMGRGIDMYTNPQSMAVLKERLPHVFRPLRDDGIFIHTCLKPHLLAAGVPISIGCLALTPFDLDHGFGVISSGFRCGDFGYSIDVHTLPDMAMDILSGVDVWIVDCLRAEPHPTHAHLAKVMEWNERIKAKRIFLTHMSHDSDYATLNRLSPSHITPCHDGLLITV